MDKPEEGSADDIEHPIHACWEINVWWRYVIMCILW